MPDTSTSVKPPTGWSPLELLAAALLLGTCAVGLVVWAGAALAAALSGQHLPAGLADAIGAAVALPDTVTDPRQAWPPPARAVLPSAPLYWACTILAAAVGAGAAVAVGRLVRRWRPARTRLGVDVRARFATRRDLRPLLIRRPQPGRFVIGRYRHHLVATENARFAPQPHPRRGRQRPGDITSVAIIGPSRSGKTAECAIPGVLDWDGPAILLSVKRDLLDATIHRRRHLGQVRVFDPAGLLTATSTSPHGSVIRIEPAELARWSPLRAAHTPAGAKKAGQALAAWTPTAGIEGGGDFWAHLGKILFTGLIGAAAIDPEGASMARLAHWVFTQDRPTPGKVSEVHALLTAALTSNNPAQVEAAAAAKLHCDAIWSKDDRLISSIYATAQTVADPYLDPTVQAVTELTAHGGDSWVDLDWLLSAPEGHANTLYLVVPLDDYQRLAPVLGGFLSDLKAQAYERDLTGQGLPAPLLMLIDEAGNMPLTWLPQVASTCAGIGIQLVTIWQSLAQIDQAYGTLANSVITNHATKLFFPAASDDTTLTYQTKIAGHEDTQRHSWTTNPHTNGHTTTTAQQTEPLVPYHLPRLAPLGQALLIHNNLPPAAIQGRRWWQDSRLRTLARAAAHTTTGRTPDPGLKQPED